MSYKVKTVLLLFGLLLSLSISVLGQRSPSKKNGRPNNDGSSKRASVSKAAPVYFYNFLQPKFLIKKIAIEHDENGLGKISFQKQKFDDDITDPLTLSESTLKRLKDLWTKLDFLSSVENYQSEARDYGHLGTMKLRMRRDGKERTAQFNWTENLDARQLVDEYRKIANQFIWMFDIGVARVNQPLEAPRIMKGLDSHLSRDAISDPQQMLPFLEELSDDERIPLIARNHASRLAKRIKKKAEKKEEPKPENEEN